MGVHGLTLICDFLDNEYFGDGIISFENENENPLRVPFLKIFNGREKDICLKCFEVDDLLFSLFWSYNDAFYMNRVTQAHFLLCFVKLD